MLKHFRLLKNFYKARKNCNKYSKMIKNEQATKTFLNATKQTKENNSRKDEQTIKRYEMETHIIRQRN